MGRAIESVLVGTASATIGAVCMYFYLDAQTAKKANVTLVETNQGLKDAATDIAGQVLALSQVTQRNQALVNGLKQHENLLKGLESCIMPDELGRLFSLQAEAINAANRAGREGEANVRKQGAGN